MNNNKKSMIVVSVGLVILLNVSGSLLAVRALSKTVDVLVVKQTLTPRTKIKEEHLEIVSMPKNTIPLNIYINMEDVIGKVVSFDASLFKGMFLFKEALEDPTVTGEHHYCV